MFPLINQCVKIFLGVHHCHYQYQYQNQYLYWYLSSTSDPQDGLGLRGSPRTGSPSSRPQTLVHVGRLRWSQERAGEGGCVCVGGRAGAEAPPPGKHRASSED